MDFNRQHQQNVAHQPLTQPDQADFGQSKAKVKQHGLGASTITAWALVAVCVILVIFGLFWYFRGTINEASKINKSEYQAVFLSNGQVYFGHLDTLNSQYAELTDIFYLQAKQTVQPKNDSSQGQDNNVQLVKLGNELHGPEDAMQINRSQVVFWENLKKSGKVTQAIDKFKTDGGNSANSSSSDSSNSTNTTSPSSTSGSSSKTNSSKKQ